MMEPIVTSLSLPEQGFSFHYTADNSQSCDIVNNNQIMHRQYMQPAT